MAVYLVTYSGTLLGGQEQFAHTLAVDDVNDGGESAIADRADTALQAFLATAGCSNNISNGTRWTNIKVARVLSLTAGTLFAGFNKAINHAGTNASAGSVPPPQAALAISLVGGPRANGTPYRGRFFLPAPQFGTGSVVGGVLDTALQTSFANGVQNWLNDLNNAVLGVSAQVWSRSAGVTSTVETIRVGRQIDTIRSRRRDMPESYADRAISVI